MATPPTTSTRHPIWARFYARISPTMDAQGAIDHRRKLLAGLADRVLEVGAGNGLNFAHYPPAVTEIPGSRLVVLPGVGHQSDMEAPERFNAEVRGFLRSVQR